jgi:hypothetical protein
MLIMYQIEENDKLLFLSILTLGGCCGTQCFLSIVARDAWRHRVSSGQIQVCQRHRSRSVPRLSSGSPRRGKKPPRFWVKRLLLVSLRARNCSLTEIIITVTRFVPLECGKVLTGLGNSITLRKDKKMYGQSPTCDTFTGMKSR